MLMWADSCSLTQQSAHFVSVFWRNFVCCNSLIIGIIRTSINQRFICFFSSVLRLPRDDKAKECTGSTLATRNSSTGQNYIHVYMQKAARGKLTIVKENKKINNKDFDIFVCIIDMENKERFCLLTELVYADINIWYILNIWIKSTTFICIYHIHLQV